MLTASEVNQIDEQKTGHGRWLTYLLPLLVLILLLGWVCRWGWVEVLAVGPRMKIELWQQRTLQPTVKELADVQSQLATAQSWNEMSADIAFERGLVAEWQALQTPVWTTPAQEHRGLAIGHFTKALELRPSWGMAWVHLANSLVLNKQLYSGALNALEKASIVAPFEFGVQQRIIWLGLSQWQYLNEEQRRRMYKIVEYAKQSSAHVAIKAIIDFRLEKEFADLFISTDDQKTMRGYLEKRKRSDKARSSR